MKLKNIYNKNIAPIEIVKNYESFQEALKIRDFVSARDCIQNMKSFQGGEKIAKELWDEFFPLLQDEEMKDEKNIQKNQELEDKTGVEELLAQKLLSHSESFEAFLEDGAYDLAREELMKIKELGDNNLFLYLSNKLNQTIEKEEERRRNIENNKIAIIARVEKQKQQQLSHAIKEDIQKKALVNNVQAKKMFLKSQDTLCDKDKEYLEAYFDEIK